MVPYFFGGVKLRITNSQRGYGIKLSAIQWFSGSVIIWEFENVDRLWRST